MIVLGTGVFAAAAGPIGIAVLVGVAARDELGLTGSTTGLLLLGGPAVALVAGPLWGRLLDRWGARVSGFVSATAVTAASAALALADTPIPLAVVSAIVGGLIGFVVVVVQALSSTVIPDNRGGALSFVLAFRFFGHGIGPVIWIPVLESSVDIAFVGASSLGIITVAALWFAASARSETQPFQLGSDPN